MRPESIRSSPLGIYLARRRKELDYSVKGLAERAQVSASGVSDLELDNRQLTGKMARKLAGPLGVTPNELLIRASLTPELPWGQALPSTEERLIELQIQVTVEEERQIRQYLDFIRFRGWVSVQTE